MRVELTIEIPDDIATRLAPNGTDLSRRALEVLALDAYKAGQLSDPELREMLGFETRYELDGFLKSHGVYDDYTVEDFELERQALKDAGY